MYKYCEKIQEELVAMRRYLHQIPEIGFDLPETCEFVTAKLNEYGIEYEYNKEFCFVIGHINKGKERVIALRADMDALVIQEATGLSFSSRHEGKMHACGHDAHTAMLLGAAKVLSEHRDQLNCEVRLIFQPHEEGTRGAAKVAENHALDGVDAIFGTHIGTLMGTQVPAGKLVVFPGPMMASSDRFKIVVKGIACHGSTPERGIDPVLTAAHIVVGLQELITREFSALDNAVLSVCTINGGLQSNAIPDKVELGGTTRAFDLGVRAKLKCRIEEIARAIASAYRCEIEFDYYSGPLPVINEEKTCEYAIQCAREVLGDENVITDMHPIMVAEDFSVYQKLVPGTFMQLSSSNPEKGTDCQHHSPVFNIDEDVLWKGSAVFVSLAENF